MTTPTEFVRNLAVDLTEAHRVGGIVRLGALCIERWEAARWEQDRARREAVEPSGDAVAAVCRLIGHAEPGYRRPSMTDDTFWVPEARAVIEWMRARMTSEEAIEAARSTLYGPKPTRGAFDDECEMPAAIAAVAHVVFGPADAGAGKAEPETFAQLGAQVFHQPQPSPTPAPGASPWRTPLGSTEHARLRGFAKWLCRRASVEIPSGDMMPATLEQVQSWVILQGKSPAAPHLGAVTDAERRAAWLAFDGARFNEGGGDPIGAALTAFLASRQRSVPVPIAVDGEAPHAKTRADLAAARRGLIAATNDVAEWKVRAAKAEAALATARAEAMEATANASKWSADLATATKRADSLLAEATRAVRRAEAGEAAASKATSQMVTLTRIVAERDAATKRAEELEETLRLERNRDVVRADERVAHLTEEVLALRRSPMPSEVRALVEAATPIVDSMILDDGSGWSFSASPNEVKRLRSALALVKDLAVDALASAPEAAGERVEVEPSPYTAERFEPRTDGTPLVTTVMIARQVAWLTSAVAKLGAR